MQFIVYTYSPVAGDPCVRESYVGLDPEEACDRFIQFLQGHGIDPGAQELSDRAAFVIDTTGTVFYVGYWEDEDEEGRPPRRSPDRAWALLRAWVTMSFPIYVDRYPASVRAGGQADFATRSLMFHRDPNAATPKFGLSLESIKPPGLVFSPWRVDIGDGLESWTFETPGYSGFVGVAGEAWKAVLSLLPGTRAGDEDEGQFDPSTGSVACQGMIIGKVDPDKVARLLSELA
jgi:hypothetical protein